jgi:uncharacterized membrane protein
MNDTKFSFPVWPLIGKAWGLFIAAFVPLFFGHIIIQVIYQAAGAFGPLVILVTGPLWYGLCQISQDAARGKPVRFEDVFAGFRLFMPTFLVGLYITVFMLAAVLVIMIPGIIACYLAFQTQSVPIISITISVSLTACLLPLCLLAILYSPAFFIMRDEGLGAWDAMEASRKMVQANLGAWIPLWVGISILHIAGILTCCIGLLFVMPWMTVILAMAYDMQREAAALGRPDYKGDELP